MSVFHSSTHDPLILSVCPNSQSFCITNASRLPPRKPPPFPLDVQEPNKPIGYEEDDTNQLADTAEQMHLSVQRYPRDEELERTSDQLDNDTLPPLLKGWRIDAEDGEDSANKLITCAMGLGGRVILGVGTNKSLWVWRYDD